MLIISMLKCSDSYSDYELSASLYLDCFSALDKAEETSVLSSSPFAEHF